MAEIYEPEEDTFLILKYIRFYASGDVLDMGTGSGVLAIEASQQAENVIGADVNEDALDYARKKAEASGLDNVQFVKSDLFSYFEDNPQRFSLIIFNPPYLPEDSREPVDSRLATTGGKKGYELLERFFSQAGNYLLPFGKILVVYSTLTGQDKVHSIIENYGFNYQKLAEEPCFGETLLLYIAEKSDLLRSLEGNGVTGIRKIAKGHRGLVFTGKLNGRKIAIKKQREDSTAIGRIENEARWLKVLNRKGIGPKFLYHEDDYFTYEFVEGEFIPAFLEKAKKADIRKVIVDVFRQCFVMDKMNVDKEEMHHPFKHVIVDDDNKPVMIDFERVSATEKPKNVTQFCQYVSGTKVLKLLKEKGFRFNKTEITSAAQRYKRSMDEDKFKDIIKLLV